MNPTSFYLLTIMLLGCSVFAAPSWALGADTTSSEADLALKAAEFWRMTPSADSVVDAAAAAGTSDVSAQQALPTLGIERLYIIPILPLSKAPKPPTAFVPFNQPKRWTFKGGSGYVFLVKYDTTPVGAYQEMFYMPGQYRPNGCEAFRNASALSTQRIWVDSQAALEATRSRGFPTELANFTWANVTRAGKPTGQSIIVRVGNVVALNVMFTLPAPGFPSWLLTPAAQADLTRPQLLWPLNATNPATAVPNLVFSPRANTPTIGSANTTVNKIDSRLFTGMASPKVANAPGPALVYWNGSGDVVPPTSLARYCP